ncbi:MAG: polyhydroxyalkanoate depolymerase, partial [Pseudomonadota bacterium]
FIEHALANGTMKHRGELVDLSAIRNVALFTIEGENDDITGRGQTEAALDLCPNIPSELKYHYEQPNVGHYGVFNGSRFRKECAPKMLSFMEDAARSRKSSKPKLRAVS